MVADLAAACRLTGTFPFIIRLTLPPVATDAATAAIADSREQSPR